MADDHTQRPTRASQPPPRPGSGNAPATSSSVDPLAELARLIGQNDPFAEFGGAAAQPSTRQAGHHEEQDYYGAQHDMPAQASYAEEPYAAPAASFPPPPGQPPHHDSYGETDHPPEEAYAPGVMPDQSDYDQEPYYPNNPHSEGEEINFYEDVPPRRRWGIIAISAIFVLAVIGGAGAFGYRALLGESAPSGPPPVIKADTTPSKIIPTPKNKNLKTGKLINDRITNGGQNAKLVPREEQPIEITGKSDHSAGSELHQAANIAPAGAVHQAPLGNGMIGVEPRKVHTIAIRPDQLTETKPPTVAAAIPAAPPAPPPEPTPPASKAIAHTKPVEQQNSEAHIAVKPASHVAAKPAEHHRVEVARVQPRHHVAPARKAPLSLSPNAPAPTARRTSERPMHTAAVAAAPTRMDPNRAVASTSRSGGYAVQVVARHSEAEAKASFQHLQSKYPQQLGGRALLIRRVNLGSKGVYYRAMVGPFASGEQAKQLCAHLKAAGGQCIIQKI